MPMMTGRDCLSHIQRQAIFLHTNLKNYATG